MVINVPGAKVKKAVPKCDVGVEERSKRAYSLDLRIEK